MGKKLSCGCDEDEFNQPCVKCADCKTFLLFPFGAGHEWVGVCKCANVLYKWEGHGKSLRRCSIDRRGIGIAYNWSNVHVPSPQEVDELVRKGEW